MQSSLASGGDSSWLCSCGNKISCKNTHQACPACLRQRYAQAAVDSLGSREHRAHFTMKSLRRTLARQASLSGQDPHMSASPALAATLQLSTPSMAAFSWDEQLNACASLPSVPCMDEEEVLDFEKEGQLDSLLSDEEEALEDSLFLPLVQLAKPLAAAGSMKGVSWAPPSAGNTGFRIFYTPKRMHEGEL